jgi:hypothetical protein
MAMHAHVKGLSIHSRAIENALIMCCNTTYRSAHELQHELRPYAYRDVAHKMTTLSSRS